MKELYVKELSIKAIKCDFKKMPLLPLFPLKCVCGATTISNNYHIVKFITILFSLSRRLFSPRARKKNKVCPFVLAFALFRSSNFLKFSKFQLLAYFKKSIQQRSIEVLKYRPVILTTVHASPPNRATLMPSNQNCTLIIIFAKHSFFYK